MGKLYSNRLLEWPRCKWQDNIKMNLRNMIGGCGLCSFGSEQELEVGSYEHSNEPLGSIKKWEFLE